MEKYIDIILKEVLHMFKISSLIYSYYDKSWVNYIYGAILIRLSFHCVIQLIILLNKKLLVINVQNMY